MIGVRGPPGVLRVRDVWPRTNEIGSNLDVDRGSTVVSDSESAGFPNPLRDSDAGQRAEKPAVCSAIVREFVYVMVAGRTEKR